MICGIVLAAGTSSRLGAPKQVLDLRGKPLLQHVIDAVCSSSLDQAIVVLGHASDIVEAAIELCDKARAVINEHYLQGQSTSLRTGLVAAHPSCDAAAILLGDQPGVTVELIDRVLDRFRSTSASVVRPTFQGIPGHPVVMRRAAWASAMGATGDAGLRQVLDGLDVEELELAIPPMRDIDTTEDYEEALKDA